MFDHCADAEDPVGETWRTLHEFALVCHPCQGGTREQMGAVCVAAREALTRAGAAWPEGWADPPAMFDLYCLAKGLDNPYGRTIVPSGGGDGGGTPPTDGTPQTGGTPTTDDGGVTPYVPGRGAEWHVLPPAVTLVSRASSGGV